MKEKNPKSDDEDDFNSIDEGSNSIKKYKKKGSSKCYYCRKKFNSEKNYFKKKMVIMVKLLEKYNIDVPDFANKSEPEKPIESPHHCHNAHSQGNNCYALSARVKYLSQLFDLDSFSDIFESEISVSSLDKSPISSLEPSPILVFFH